MTSQPDPDSPAVTDAAASDPASFAPPTGPPVEPERSAGSNRSIPAVVIILTCLALLIAGTWWAGGFDKATGRLFRLPPGTEVNMGPMSIAVDRALARESFGSWSVYAFGRCRNNTDEPLVSSEDRLVYNGFSMQHPVTREIVGEASLFFGPGETIGNSSVLNPGTPMVPCTLAFDFDDFPGTDIVTLGVSEMEWIDRSPTGEGDMVWSAARIGYRFELPLVTQPDTDR